VLAGIEGIGHKLDPGPPESDPYSTAHAILPKSPEWEQKEYFDFFGE